MRITRKKLQRIVLVILAIVASNSFWIGWWFLSMSTNCNELLLTDQHVHVPHPDRHMQDNRNLHNQLHHSKEENFNHSKNVHKTHNPNRHKPKNVTVHHPNNNNNNNNNKSDHRTVHKTTKTETHKPQTIHNVTVKQPVVVEIPFHPMHNVTAKQNNDDKNHDEIPSNPDSRQSLLNCSAHGGPYDFESVEAMVYWKDIPQDSNYQSKFHSNETKYLTYDTDLAGFNNQRMVFEINLVTAIVTGRTMVLPLSRYLSHEAGKIQLHEFFGLKEIAKQLPKALKLMDFDEFLAQEGTPDKLHIPTNFTGFYKRAGSRIHRHVVNGTTVEDVDTNGTDYHDRFLLEQRKELKCSLQKTNPEYCSNYTKWMQQRHPVNGQYRYFMDEFLTGHPKVYSPEWGANKCLLTIPNVTLDQTEAFRKRFSDMIQVGFHLPGHETENDAWSKRRAHFVGNPAAAHADPGTRLAQVYWLRQALCTYAQNTQHTAKYFHQQDRALNDSRLMAHFYDYLFFEDWKEDLWVKRFVRDKVRYPDALQCAAARIVAALNQLDGTFYTMHIRRTDLNLFYGKYGVNRTALQIYEEFTVQRQIIPKDSIVYIATDETDFAFFDDFVKHYKQVLFLKDFSHLISDISTQHYGMIDQLVCTKGEKFLGVYYSTFTGYINRLRGYHSQKPATKSLPVLQQGQIPSWFYAPSRTVDNYQRFEPITNSLFSMEFAMAWRNIDYDVDPVLREQVDRMEANKKVPKIVNRTLVKVNNVTVGYQLHPHG